MTQITKLAVIASFLLCHQTSWSQGIPYFQNFKSADYRAHNQNFDIVACDDGTVYVANFEGLLYYENAQWRIIYTPGITRVTSLFLDSRGTLWTGGYNYIGLLETDDKGSLCLRRISKGTTVSGEVTRIWETNGQVYMHVSDGSDYALSDSTITPHPSALTSHPSPLTSHPSPLTPYIINDVESLGGIYAFATNGDGVVFTDERGQELCRITEHNGLCSDNVNRLAYNGHGLLWGATDNGVFAAAVPSAYTHFTSTEGLHGEVLSIAQLGSTVYAGTSGGLFFLRGERFEPVDEISLACWQLQKQGDHLLAATAAGLFAVEADRKVRVITTAATLSVLADGDTIYTGEMDGVYRNHRNGQRKKVWNIEKVVSMVYDDKGILWLQNLYGKIWHISPESLSEPAPLDNGTDEIHTLVSYQGRVTPVSASDDKPFPYPLFSFADDQGTLWLTSNKGKKPYAMKNGEKDERMSQLVYPLMDYSVRAMMRHGKQIWMGGDKGMNIVNSDYEDPALTVMPRLFIRSVNLHGDSLLWGGYGPMPDRLPRLDSKDRHVVFTYSIDFPSLLLLTQYRTRINGGSWSAWETATTEEYSNLTYGDYYFEVQARDAYGRESDIVGMGFTITPPFHLRWYMLVLYLLIAAAVVYALVRFRLYRLEKDKHRLEAVVQERTADLVEAQHELVRQEKMATVGKLTKGLIDRILNPLNYINNFAKLSEGLVNDVMANIEDEKENITPDTYDDTVDVLEMLRGNLQKVGEHGAITSRVLKAMEEMLKDRSGGQTDMSLTDMLRQDEQMTYKYYEKEMAEYGIAVSFTIPDGEIHIKGNAQLLSMTVMSLLRNAVYAVVKKSKRQAEQTVGNNDYRPEVKLTMTVAEGKALIAVHDNGIGIESTIIDRVFDPFFTTKTTAEASGVGLYISREVVQNHGGDITVASVKDSYTEFIITIPLLKE